MRLFVPIQIEMFQGDETGSSVLGVYDSQEGADGRIQEVESVDMYDPLLRYVYDTMIVELNQPYVPEYTEFE